MLSGFGNEVLHDGSGSTFSGMLDIKPEYEIIPMMTLPKNAVWVGDNPSHANGTASRFGFRFQPRTSIAVHAVGMDSRTSDGRTNPTRLVIKYRPGKPNEAIVVDVMLHRHVKVGHDYKMLIPRTVLVPGLYSLTIELFDSNNILRYGIGSTRPFLNPLDARLDMEWPGYDPSTTDPMAFANTPKTISVRTFPLGTVGYADDEEEVSVYSILNGGVVQAYCGNIWCEVIKHPSIIRCGQLSLTQSDSTIKHTLTGGKYMQIVHPNLMIGNQSMIGSGLGNLSFRDPLVTDRYTVEIILRSPFDASCRLVSRIGVFPVYSSQESLIANRDHTITWEFHPPANGNLSIDLAVTDEILILKFRVMKTF